MLNREKVIKELTELHDKAYENWVHSQRNPFLAEVGKACEDAIALLKEQEAREQCLKTKCIICPHCDNCDVDENGLLKEQKAEWIEYPECLAYDGAYSDSHIVCSACKHVFSIMDNCTEEFDYCPHCGAKMK